MTTNISGSADPMSATIYTFPPRGRFALRVDGDAPAAAANVQLPRGVKLVSGGSGWYHDEAIKAERRGDRGGKN
jgi:Protein of unknown function (DUF2735)